MISVPLIFSNINNFDVAGDNAIKTLGNLIGMTIIFNPDSDFVSGFGRSLYMTE